MKISKAIRKVFEIALAPVISAIRFLKICRLHPSVKFHSGVSVGANCKFGVGVWIGPHVRLLDSTIGSQSYVGGNSTLKFCRIGKFCSIGEGVQIGLGIHPTDQVSTYPGFYSSSASGVTRFLPIEDATQLEEPEFLPVKIGNDVWIGNRATILDGINVGHGAVIGAGAIVTRDVEPFAIVTGVPARLARKRFSESFCRFLLRTEWWDWDTDLLRKRAHLFSNPMMFEEHLREEMDKPRL